MTDKERYNAALDEFRHHDIDIKLELIFDRLWEMHGKISSLEARSAIIGGLTGGIVTAIIGGFIYMVQG